MGYASFQQKLDQRFKQIGDSVGQPFNGFRPGSGSGDFPDGWQFVGPTNIFRYKTPMSRLEVGVERSEILYNIFFDAASFRLGDVFVCTDPFFSPGESYGPEASSLPCTKQINGIAFNWHQPSRVLSGARIDRRVRIYRPASSPSALPDASPYWKETQDNAQPLVLIGGKFSFGAAGVGAASWVPGGFMSVTRRSDYPFDKEPGIVRSLGWIAYLPPLPGYQATEGDLLTTEDGARYVMLGGYIQEVGMVGTYMIIDRKISQDA